MKLARRFVEKLGRRASWILSAKILLSLFVLVYAVSISISSTTYQAEVGTAVNVTNNLLATDKGFNIASTGTSATSCSSPVTFTFTPGVANNQITAGDFVYDVQVNTTAGAPAGAKYNATLTLASSSYGPVCIKLSIPAISGQTIDCKFDIGGNILPTSPYSLKITIQ